MLDASPGFTYHDLDEAEVARATSRNAASPLVLADHTKRGWLSRTVVCPCGNIDDLVSDAGDDALALYRQAGVRRTHSTR